MTTTHENTLRRLLCWILLLGIAGVAAELALLGHYEGWRQQAPLVMLGLGLVTTLGAAIGPTPFWLKLHGLVMFGFLVSGGLGLYFHYSGNAEFEKEMVPTIGGWELIREALTGATPALAPGTMFLLGFVGLAIAYRHPLLRRDDAPGIDVKASV